MFSENLILLQEYETIVLGYKAFWANPKGKFFYAPKGHAEFSQTMHNLKISDNFEDVEKAYDLLYSKGWLRVTVEKHQVLFTYDSIPPNRIQLKELKDFAIEKNIPLMNDVTNRVVYSPFI